MTLKEKIRFWFDDLETPMGRGTDLLIMALIVLSCFLAVVLTYHDPTSGIYRWLWWLDEFISVFFLIEYLLRLWMAEKRLKYFFSLYALIDLVAVLPVIPIVNPQIHVLRIFRLFRIFRLVRFLENQKFFFGSIEKAHLFALRVLFTLFSIPFVSAGLFFFAEEKVNPHINTFFDAFYFSVVTLTTVGFGDITPLTLQGKVVAILMISAGIIFIPLQVKNLIAHFFEQREKEERRCTHCGLEYHERDARHCKRCGSILPERESPGDEETLTG